MAGPVAAAPLPPLPDNARPAGETPSEPSALRGDVPTPKLDVPPVYNRPLGIEEGPRVHVRKFRLVGVVERPEQEITLDKLNELVETERKIKQGLNSEVLRGLSREAGLEIARTLLQEDDPDIDFKSLIQRLRQSRKFRESMTMGQIQEVANKLTSYYRERGLVVAVAFVPAQMVKDGVVTIQVTAGHLSQIKVENNHSYTTEQLIAPFSSQLGLAVNKDDLESSLLRVSDYPGLTLSGLLEAGEEPGSSALRLVVSEERRHEFELRADNHGSSSTGEYRTKLGYQLNNPTGRADKFNLVLLNTYQPDNSLFGSLSYITPLWNDRNRLSAEWSRNSFEVGQAFKGLEVTGSSVFSSISYHHSIVRGRGLNLDGRIKLGSKRAETLQERNTLSTDELTTLGAELEFYHLDTRFGMGINQGSIRYVRGLGGKLGAMDAAGSPYSSRVGGSGQRAGGDFSKLVLNYTRFQNLSESQSLLLRANLLYSDDLLTSLEQSSLGGPDSVRAYPVAEYLRDKSLYVGLDWNFKLPGSWGQGWAESVQLALTGDYAMARNVDPQLSEEKTLRLSGVGVAMQYAIPNRLQVRLDLATPVGKPEPSNERSLQYYLMVDYAL